MPANDPDHTAPHIPPERTADYAPDDPNRTAARPASETPAGTGTVARTPSDVSRLEEAAQAQVGESVPGYVLLGELGRGGMGVVYKARHVKLNRVVALKMMLGGEQASRGELLRFLAEAEAVAAVRHENVVQVYDYGESAGRPFMALEFCPGGTLGKLLPKGRDAARAPREMAALVAQVARGVAAAHAQGIIHRDLKPGNVFLDDDGVPKVADFGLAKRGEGSDVTQAGVGMGTPAYMSPEQARDAKFVGPQADVWALGVMLYEALTGTRPFTGTVQEILAKAQNTEPLAPRKALGSVPRDLDLICLKCLAKQPHERYPTAKELADDLDRFARGEPISVRPAGPIERAYKWVKRNKVVSGAVIAVFLALVVGAGVSFAFGLDARDQATKARKQKKEAEDATVREEEEKLKVIAARNDLKEKNDELLRSRERVNRTLAKALLGPITATDRERALTPFEVETFWQIAELRQDAVAWMFLEAATQTPLACNQLGARAEFALHAVVGLDPAARDRADALLFARLTAPGTTAAQRTSLALACSRSGFVSPRTADAAATALTTVMNDTAMEATLCEQAIGVAALAPYMKRERATAVCESAAQRLTEAIAKTRFESTVDKLAACLAGLAPYLAPERAAAHAEAATQRLATAMTNSTSEYFLFMLAKPTIPLAPYLPPVRSAEVVSAAVRRIIEVMAKSTDQTVSSALSDTLSELAPLLTPEYTTRAARQFTDALQKATAPVALGPLASGLAVLARRLPPEEAARLLTGAIAEATNLTVVIELTRGLVAVVPFLPPDRAATACTPVAQRFTATLGKATQVNALCALAELLAALAPYLPPDQAAISCTAAAARLNDALVTNKDPNAVHSLAKSVVAVAPRLPADQAAAVLADATARTTDGYALRELAKGLGATVPRLRRDRRTPVSDAAAERLLGALALTTNEFACGALAEGMAALAVYLPPERAAAVCEKAAKRLLDELSKPLKPYALRAHAWSLIGVAGYLPPERSTAALMKAVQQLGAALDQPGDEYVPHTIAMDLVAVVRALPPEHIGPATQRLLDTMRQTKPGYPYSPMKRALWAAAHGFPESEEPRSREAAVLGAGAFATPHNLLPSLPLLHPHFQPQTRPLPAQTLVELLKHPLCVGETRRVVLDALEFTYKQSFKDQWEFVAYAQKHKLELDLLAPPRRSTQP